MFSKTTVGGGTFQTEWYPCYGQVRLDSSSSLLHDVCLVTGTFWQRLAHKLITRVASFAEGLIYPVSLRWYRCIVPVKSTWLSGPVRDDRVSRSFKLSPPHICQTPALR
jgi:hypothetical protein